MFVLVPIVELLKSINLLRIYLYCCSPTQCQKTTQLFSHHRA